MINKKSEIFSRSSKINHIGFIMDGNRRYSVKQKISQREGYRKGMEKFLEYVSYQVKYNIKETSFFALSSDNCNSRSPEELKTIFELIEFFSKNEQIEEFFKINKVKVNLIGDIDTLEKNQKKIDSTKKKIISELKEKFNSQNKEIGKENFIVNVALNYGGQDEIAYACKQICEKVQSGELKINKINDKIIKENLWFKGKPAEIIVRSGDAPRLSGFMLFDSAYSEIYFSKKLWPEMDETDFVGIINWYNSIKRNFGK